MPTEKQRQVFTVIVGQGWKYRLPEIVKRIPGARLTRGWQYTDATSTEVSIRVSFPGRAEDLQRAFWAGEMSACSVYVR